MLLEPEVLTPALLANAITRKQQFNARRELLAFTTYTYPEYRVAWFHRYMAWRLNLWATGKLKRLIIQVPPRRGKSELMSRRLPAFCFGLNPDERIIACSHTANLASSMNRDTQRIMDSKEYKQVFPETRLGEDNIRTIITRPLRNNDEFDIVYTPENGDSRIGGYYRCAGVGTKIAGRGFTKGLIDDYVGEQSDAESPTMRNSLWEWYISDFYSRCAPNAGIVICGTRRHEDDLIGRLLKLAAEDPSADQWEVITFPEINDYLEAGLEQPEYDIRKPGEVLWGEAFSLEEAIKQRAGSAYLFSSLYQQRPVAREGNAIKWAWFEPYEHFLDLTAIIGQGIYWDLGGSDDKNADRTAGTVGVQLRDGRVIILWQHAGQWTPLKRDEEIETFCLIWHNIFPGIPIHIEGGIGLGVDSVNRLHNRLLAKNLNVRIDRVNQSKYIRASAQKDSFFAAAEGGRIKPYVGNVFREELVGYGEPLDWVNEQKIEFTRLQFKDTPHGVEFVGGHDDRLDSEVGCYNKLTQKSDWGIETINF